jgi:hypothetical protein
MEWLLGWMGSRRKMKVINAIGERCKIERLELTLFRLRPNCSGSYNGYILKTSKVKK